MAELKPCPFCGGEAKIIHGRPYQQKQGKRTAFVHCRQCNAKAKTFTHLPYQNWKDVERCAIEAWNRRAGDTDG